MALRSRFCRLFIVLVVAVLLTACTSPGPVKSSEFASFVQEGLPSSASSVTFATEAEWIKGAYGFRKAKRLEEEDYEHGVLALTDDGVYFLIWENEGYIPVFQKPYKDIIQ